MKKSLGFVFLLMLIGAGCASLSTTSIAISNRSSTNVVSESQSSAIIPTHVSTSTIVLPIDEYVARRRVKVFGQLVHDRFNGYHLGDDIEYTDATGTPIFVYALTNAKVRYLNPHVSGYGGVIVLQFTLHGQVMNALYGHLDLRKTALRVGSFVTHGQKIAMLGEGYSYQTDGERKHLHFSLYPGTMLRLQGYVSTKALLKNWMDPLAFFKAQGVIPQ